MGSSMSFTLLFLLNDIKIISWCERPGSRLPLRSEIRLGHISLKQVLQVIVFFWLEAWNLIASYHFIVSILLIIKQRKLLSYGIYTLLQQRGRTLLLGRPRIYDLIWHGHDLTQDFSEVCMKLHCMFHVLTVFISKRHLLSRLLYLLVEERRTLALVTRDHLLSWHSTSATPGSHRCFCCLLQLSWRLVVIVALKIDNSCLLLLQIVLMHDDLPFFKNGSLCCFDRWGPSGMVIGL